MTYMTPQQFLLRLNPNVDSVPQPPQEHLTVDMSTGRWKCTDVGGEMDSVFADLGVGFIGKHFKLQAMARANCFETSNTMVIMSE